MTGSYEKTMLVLTIAALAIAAVAQETVNQASSQPLQVEVNGEAVTFPDTQPTMIGSVVMVPIRQVCEQMGASVDWDEATQTATCTVNGSKLILQLGSSEGSLNGDMVYLALPPREIGDRTMVPAMLFHNAFGDDVTWDAGSGLVAIDTSGSTASTNASTNHDSDNTTVGGSTTPVAGSVNLTQGEIVPISLDTPLSSSTSQVGDTFTATVVADTASGYEDLPSGTQIEGHVAAVQPMTSDQPGILDLKFDRIDFPNGQSQGIDGSLISLNSPYAMEGDNGAYYTADQSGPTFDRMA